jgi:hypothetical protein
MTDSNPDSQMNSDEAWKLHTRYVKARLVWQLANQITSLIPAVLLNSLRYCSMNYTWSDEEQVRIRKIVTVLEGIRELHLQLETLSQPLIDTYKRPSSSAPTSMPSQMTTDGGDAHTSRPE